jgi:hypothetical protein
MRALESQHPAVELVFAGGVRQPDDQNGLGSKRLIAAWHAAVGVWPVTAVATSALC